MNGPFNMDKDEYKKSRRGQRGHRKPTQSSDKNKYPRRRLPADPYGEESSPHSCWLMTPFRGCMGRDLLNNCFADHNNDMLGFTSRSFDNPLFTETFTTKLHVASSSLTEDYRWKRGDIFGRSDSQAMRQTNTETADGEKIAILHDVNSFDGREERPRTQLEELETSFVPIHGHVPSDGSQAAMMKSEAQGCEYEHSFSRRNISNREVAVKTISIPEQREDTPHEVYFVRNDEILRMNPDNPPISILKKENQGLDRRQRDYQCPQKVRTDKLEEDEKRLPPPNHEHEKKQLSERRRHELEKREEVTRSTPRDKNRPTNGKKIRQPAVYHRLYAASSAKQQEGKRRRAELEKSCRENTEATYSTDWGKNRPTNGKKIRQPAVFHRLYAASSAKQQEGKKRREMLEKSYRENMARRNGELVKDTGKISIEKASKLYDRCMSSKKKTRGKSSQADTRTAESRREGSSYPDERSHDDFKWSRSKLSGQKKPSLLVISHVLESPCH